MRRVTQSFEVHSNESACRKKVRLGLEQVRDKEGKIDVKTGKYDTNNQPKKSTFKYEQEKRFCLCVAKIKGKNGMIIGKRCPVFDYSGEKIVIIDACKKEVQKEFARV